MMTTKLGAPPPLDNRFVANYTVANKSGGYGDTTEKGRIELG